jgi:hypothetical protein
MLVLNPLEAQHGQALLHASYQHTQLLLYRAQNPQLQIDAQMRSNRLPAQWAVAGHSVGILPGTACAAALGWGCRRSVSRQGGCWAQHSTRSRAQDPTPCSFTAKHSKKLVG